jgi:hypothetical protein
MCNIGFNPMLQNMFHRGFNSNFGMGTMGMNNHHNHCGGCDNYSYNPESHANLNSHTNASTGLGAAGLFGVNGYSLGAGGMMGGMLGLGGGGLYDIDPNQRIVYGNSRLPGPMLAGF